MRTRSRRASPAPVTPTSYAQTSGFVFDLDPRTISNLIVDQTANNPAAAWQRARSSARAHVTSPGLDGMFGTADDRQVFFIPNVTPDVGLTAPFNAWLTFFGQFFDHGLDLVTKGGNGTIFIPLQPDDPLYSPGRLARPTSWCETRATNAARPRRRPGHRRTTSTSNENTTTPFVDQNQTYTSHPSHQVFLRAYSLDADGASRRHRQADHQPRPRCRWPFRHRRRCRHRNRRHGHLGRGEGSRRATFSASISPTRTSTTFRCSRPIDYGNFIKGAARLAAGRR